VERPGEPQTHPAKSGVPLQFLNVDRRSATAGVAISNALLQHVVPSTKKSADAVLIQKEGTPSVLILAYLSAAPVGFKPTPFSFPCNSRPRVGAVGEDAVWAQVCSQWRVFTTSISTQNVE